MATAALALLATLAAEAGVGSGELELVVFCRERTGVCAAARRTLGTGANGFWAVVGDSAILGGGGPLRPILYFTPRDYERAVAGLDAQERERAVQRRLELWTKDPVSLVLNGVNDDLMQAAKARHEDAAAVDTLVEAAAAPEGDRLKDTKPAEALKLAGESLAELLAEEPPAAAAAGYAREAAAYLKLQVDLGYMAAPGASPFAEPEPVYFVTPVSPASIRSLRAEGAMLLEWRGGIVAPFRPRQLEQMFGQRPARILYPARAPFLKDLLTLTDAQMDRRLRARVGGVSASERAEFVAWLAFKHATLCRLLTGALRVARVPWLSRWNDALRVDAQSLRSLLARARSSGPPQSAPDRAEVQAHLQLAQWVARQVAVHRTAGIARAANLVGGLP
jgi:hypothetical protein